MNEPDTKVLETGEVAKAEELPLVPAAPVSTLRDAMTDEVDRSSTAVDAIELLHRLVCSNERDLRELRDRQIQELAVDPILRSIALVVNRLRSAVIRVRSFVEMPKASCGQTEIAITSELSTIEAALWEILASHGVDEVQAQLGERFDAHLHTRVSSRTVITSVSERDGRIAEQAHPGYCRGDHLIVKPFVVLFAHQAESTVRGIK